MITKLIGYRNNIRWYRQTSWYDIETGEQLKQKQIDTEYYIVTRTKKIIINNETARTITHTNGCRRKPEQGKLPFEPTPIRKIPNTK